MFLRLREVSIVALSETVLILAGGTAVLSILFGIRVAMRALAAGEAAPRSDGGQAAMLVPAAAKRRVPMAIMPKPLAANATPAT